MGRMFGVSPTSASSFSKYSAKAGPVAVAEPSLRCRELGNGGEMDRLLCVLPDEVASDLVESGDAYRPLVTRSNSVALLAVLATSADIVSLAMSGPAIRIAMERVVNWARRAQDDKLVLRIGSDVVVEVQIPAEVRDDPRIALELSTQVLQTLADRLD